MTDVIGGDEVWPEPEDDELLAGVAAAALDANDLELTRQLAGRAGYQLPEMYRLNVEGIRLMNGDLDDGNDDDEGDDDGPRGTFIAARPFVIRQRLRDDRGETWYVIAWLTDDERVQIKRVHATDTTDKGRLTKIFSEHVVTSGNANQCVAYVTEMLRENRRWLVQYGESIVTALGWATSGLESFVSGPNRPVAVEDIKNTGRWLEGYRTEGSFDAWRDALMAAADRPLVQLMTTASLAAPLLRVVGASNFTVDLSGRTTAGKSTAHRMAVAAWAHPDQSMMSWKMTRAAIEHHASMLRGMPLSVDETQLAHGRFEDVEDMVYAVTEGRSKGRSRQDGSSLQDSVPWETVMLTTGEQSVTSATKKGGVTPRTVTATGTPCASKEQADLLNETARANFGHAGPRFVDWLLETADHDVIRSRYVDWRRRLNAAANNTIAGRRSDSVAVLALANELAHEVLELPLMSADDWVWVVNGGGAIEDGEEDRAEQALSRVLTWAVNARRNFWSMQGQNGSSFDTLAMEDFRSPGGGGRDGSGWLGRWDHVPDARQPYIAFDPAALVRQLENWGYQAEAIINDWRDRDWLKHDRGKTRATCRLMGKAGKYVIVTNLGQLDEQETEGDAGSSAVTPASSRPRRE